MKMGYEEDFLLYLEGLAAEVDRRIKRGHARLALNAAHHAVSYFLVVLANFCSFNNLLSIIFVVQNI